MFSLNRIVSQLLGRPLLLGSVFGLLGSDHDIASSGIESESRRHLLLLPQDGNHFADAIEVVAT